MKKFTILLFLLSIQMSLFAQITIEATIPFQGYEETAAFLGVGEYQIYLDNVDGVLDKPIIIVDGFDPNNSSSTDDIYSVFNYGDPVENILDDLRTNEGADIIILNFPTYIREADGEEILGGADYIERNAMVLVELIETIKAEMIGEQQLVTIGLSMGGLITRYALTYMESNGLDHQTQLWVSFDAPHKGANVPMSIQYMVNYLAEVGADENMQELRDSELNSPAAKQMLLDHYSSHLLDGEAYLQDTSIQLPTPATAFREQFTTSIDLLGYPTEPRNICISNGSNNGTPIESPGVTMIDTNLPISDYLTIDLFLAFTPDAGIVDHEVDRIQAYYFGSPFGDPYITLAASSTTSAGLDSAPGGAVMFENFLGSGGDSGIVDIFIEALEVTSFSFIPALSSLAIDNDNWYMPSASATLVFDAFVSPTENQQHLTVTNDNVEFLVSEISTLYVGTEDLVSTNFKLVNNPVKDIVQIQVNNNYEQLNVLLTNSLGQNIASYTFTNTSDSISFPSPENGYYLISIANESARITKKLIVSK